MKTAYPVIFSLPLLLATPLTAQTMLDDISLSDPFVLADEASQNYYLTGTGGDIWSSTDLEFWTKLPWALNSSGVQWVGASFTQPSPGQIWAPEVYQRGGKYYNFVTFTAPNAYTEGTSYSRRSVHILRSNSPEGPYTQMSDGDALYLPATKMAIDGTLWEEDGKPYMVYCYEWVQAKDGAIEYIELKPDLTGTVGESHHILSCSDGRAWNNDVVTDGPYLFRTQTGRLGMVWTSWRSGVYVQGVAYSDNGKLNGKWTQSLCPLTPDNHGHGMLFRDFQGQLLMSIHSNRNIDLNAQRFERHPVLFVMDDSGNELRAVMQYRRTYGVHSPSSVVVQNADFDYGKAAWTNTTQAQNCLIAHNQTGAIEGNFFESWDANSYTGEIVQELHVPNGTYRLEAAAFRNSLANGYTGENNEAVSLFANEDSTPITSDTPKDYTVSTYVSDGVLRIGLRANQRHYKWMGIDRVRVTYYGAEEVSADSLQQALGESQAVYLRNVKTGRWLNAGASWGTQAVLAPHPIDLYMHTLADGRVVFDTQLSNGGDNHYVAANGYMDGTVAPFTLTKEQDGSILLSTNGSQYWGASGTSGISTQLGAGNAAARWQLFSHAQLLNSLSQATEANPVDATFLLRAPQFGRNDKRTSTAWTGIFTVGGDVKNQCAQASAENFRIAQTLTNIPNGIYEVHAQGFYRQGEADAAATLRAEGKEVIHSKLFANNAEQPLQSIFAHANHSSIPSDAATQTTQGRVPSTLEAASAMFSRSLYANTLRVEVTDGTLTLGIKKTTGNMPADNWTVFDNFELFYLGEVFQSPVFAPSTDARATQDVCDLQGRKTPLRAMRKGVYVVDGRKKVVG